MPQCPPRWDEKFIPTQEVSPSGITKITPVDYSTGFFYAPVSPPRWDEKFIPTQEVSPSGITKITPVDYSTGFFMPQCPPRWDEKFIPTQEVSPSGITTKIARTKSTPPSLKLRRTGKIQRSTKRQISNTS